MDLIVFPALHLHSKQLLHTTNLQHAGTEPGCFYCTEFLLMASTHFWQHGSVPLLLLLGVGVIQQVWLKGVELGELVHGEVPLHLLLVHHPEGQRLLRHLPVVDLVLHGPLNTQHPLLTHSNTHRWKTAQPPTQQLSLPSFCASATLKPFVCWAIKGKTFFPPSRNCAWDRCHLAVD